MFTSSSKDGIFLNGSKWNINKDDNIQHQLFSCNYNEATGKALDNNYRVTTLPMF